MSSGQGGIFNKRAGVKHICKFVTCRKDVKVREKGVRGQMMKNRYTTKEELQGW